MVLYRFTDVDAGVEALVIRNYQGWAVTLRDTDADEMLGMFKIFPGEAQAIAYARKCAGQGEAS